MPASRFFVLLALVLSGAFVQAPGARAQERSEGRPPRVMFLVEDSAWMQQPWGSAGTRWEVTRDALVGVFAATPPGVELAVALSADSTGAEASGYEALVPFGVSRGQAVAALAGFEPARPGITRRRLAESYAALLGEWSSGSSWASESFDAGAGGPGPFELPCDEAVVVVIGTGSDLQAAGAVSRGALGSNPGYDCSFAYGDDAAGFDDCLLDDVADFAFSDWVSPWGARQAVRTHAILLDPAAADSHAEHLYRSTGMLGGSDARYVPVLQPLALASALTGSVQAATAGEHRGGGLTVSPRGHRLFATSYELDGHPLPTGRLRAFALQTDPGHAAYGEVVPGRGPQGEVWEAGALLDARVVLPGERNQGTYGSSGGRNGFVAGEAAGMYSAFLPFDAAGVASGELVSLLVNETPASANAGCGVLPQDYDFDCDVDADDAQLLVDFLRGATGATFRHSDLPRGGRRLGDAGLGRPVYAPSTSATVATDPSFARYQQKLEAKPSMVYLASDAGMLHAFEATQGHEFWFVVPRAKARWDAPGEYPGHQVQDLMHSGRTAVNTGTLNLQHAWLDGYLSDLPGCPGPAYSHAARDGAVDPDGCEWHRVLVWSGGRGSRHTYAVDVTNPEHPRFLWERTDGSSSGAGQGRAMAAPAVASFLDASVTPPQMRWLTVSSAGPQGPTADLGTRHWAHAAVYVHDLEATAWVPTVYPEAGIPLPAPAEDRDGDGFREYDPAQTEGLFGAPGLADLDGDGSVDVGYVGDSLGNLYKLRFRSDRPAQPEVCLFATASSGDASRAAFHAPSVFFDDDHRLNVWWATGGPFDRFDVEAGGGLYARVDPRPYGCAPSVPVPCAAGSSLFDAEGFHAFEWAGEKAVGALTVRQGRLFAATYTPAGCGPGESRLLGIDVLSCEGGLYDQGGDAYAVQDSLWVSVAGRATEPVFANGRLYTTVSDGAGVSALQSLVVRPAGSAAAYLASARTY